jgi:branched-chain amino acid transport system permease protein
VGIIEILGASYLSSTYKDLLAFALMIAFLLWRPQGLFGERVAERG